ncbi:MAG: hypothetical protein WD036_06355 [Bauldia sp.]
MARLFRHYVQYRRVGFGRAAALHFAWLVATAQKTPSEVLRLAKR